MTVAYATFESRVEGHRGHIWRAKRGSSLPLEERTRYREAYSPIAADGDLTLLGWAVQKGPRLLRTKRNIVSRGHPATTGEYDMSKFDQFVLREALKTSGFADIRVCEGHESRIAGWERWDFDRAAEGTLVEPGLYLEAS